MSKDILDDQIVINLLKAKSGTSGSESIKLVTDMETGRSELELSVLVKITAETSEAKKLLKAYEHGDLRDALANELSFIVEGKYK